MWKMVRELFLLILLLLWNVFAFSSNLTLLNSDSDIGFAVGLFGVGCLLVLNAMYIRRTLNVIS